MHDLPLVPTSWLKIQKRRSGRLQLKKKLKRISGARPPGIDGLRLGPSVPLPDNQRLHVLLFHSTHARLNCELPICENGNVRANDYKIDSTYERRRPQFPRMLKSLSAPAFLIRLPPFLVDTRTGATLHPNRRMGNDGISDYSGSDRHHRGVHRETI